MDLRLLPLYFVIGGLSVAISVYYGSRGQGLLAAFISLFPGVTVITFCSIYFSAGAAGVVSYARGMLILLPPWILYVVGIILLTPRLGLAPTLVASVAIYAGTALLILKFT
jgi:hypothetical protein